MRLAAARPGPMLAAMSEIAIKRAAQDDLTALVDETIERYVDWRTDCRAVQSWYQRWCGACVRERAGVFASYVAALDSEARSANHYARVLERYTRHLWPEPR